MELTSGDVRECIVIPLLKHLSGRTILRLKSREMLNRKIPAADPVGRWRCFGHFRAPRKSSPYGGAKFTADLVHGVPNEDRQ